MWDTLKHCCDLLQIPFPVLPKISRLPLHLFSHIDIHDHNSIPHPPAFLIPEWSYVQYYRLLQEILWYDFPVLFP